MRALQSRLVRHQLSPVFSALWLRVSRSELNRVPDGCGDLIWCDGTPYVCGPSLAAARLPLSAATHLVGIRFLPGAAAKWLGANAADIVGICEPLQAFGKARAERLIRDVGDAGDALSISTRLEAALIDTVSPRTSLDRGCLDLILNLLERDRGKERFLSALQRAYGLSERSVRRETIKVFGYSPKTVERIARVQRFLRTAQSARSTNLARLASAMGFADQAHMTREVHSIAGVTPNEALRLACTGDGFSNGWHCPR